MRSRGAVLLPMVIMMSGILFIIGMAGLVVGVGLNRSLNSNRLSEKALFGAQAGVSDAMRKIIRNPQWSPSCASFASSTDSFSVGGVGVTTCVSKTGAAYTVQSLGAIQGMQRRVDAVIEADTVTGQVRLTSSNEVVF